jgi:hypothetical protein
MATGPANDEACEITKEWFAQKKPVVLEGQIEMDVEQASQSRGVAAPAERLERMTKLSAAQVVARRLKEQ